MSIIMRRKCQSIGCTGRMNVGLLMLTGMIGVGYRRPPGHLHLRIGSMVSGPEKYPYVVLKKI